MGAFPDFLEMPTRGLPPAAGPDETTGLVPQPSAMRSGTIAPDADHSSGSGSDSDGGEMREHSKGKRAAAIYHGGSLGSPDQYLHSPSMHELRYSGDTLWGGSASASTSTIAGTPQLRYAPVEQGHPRAQYAAEMFGLQPPQLLPPVRSDDSWVAEWYRLKAEQAAYDAQYQNGYARNGAAHSSVYLSNEDGATDEARLLGDEHSPSGDASGWGSGQRPGGRHSRRAPFSKRYPRTTLALRFVPLLIVIALATAWFSYRRADLGPDGRWRNKYAKFLDEDVTEEELGYAFGPPVKKPWEVMINDPYQLAESHGPQRMPAPPVDEFDFHNRFLPKWFSAPGLGDAQRRAAERLAPIESQQWLARDGACVQEWIGAGTLCERVRTDGALRAALAKGQPVDLVFTWVNGSDTLHEQTRAYHLYCLTTRSKAHDELCPAGVRYSPARNGTELVDESEAQREEKLRVWTEKVWPILKARKERLPRDADYFNAQSRQKAVGASDMRFWDMDELRYAIRSAVKHMPNLRTVHIVSPDFPAWAVPHMARAAARDTGRSVRDVMREIERTHVRWTSSSDGSQRVGQVPQWLDRKDPNVIVGEAAQHAPDPATAEPGKAPVQVRLHHDWSLYDVAGSDGDNARKIVRKQAAFPTFNSMAIESVLDESTIPGLADTIFVANDDFLVLKDLSASDVVSPLYGPILRFQDNLPTFGRDLLSWSRGGEWPGVEWASHLLDERFGTKTRRYAAHVHRALSRSLLHETRLMWREDLAASASARFRGLGINLVNHYLAFNLVIERHREATLWSYVMLRLDADGDGQISSSELAVMRDSFAHDGTGASVNVSDVRIPRRSTIEKKHLADVASAIGMAREKQTDFVFSSGDGFPYTDLNPAALRYSQVMDASQRPGSNYAGWPNYAASAVPANAGKDAPAPPPPACKFNWEECLPQDRSSEAVFKHIAFAHPQCGDCLITHLVEQSGEAGLSAVLPPAEQRLPTSRAPHATSREVPHLPMARKWNITEHDVANERRPDFSVAAVAAESGWSGASAREFASQLLMRYSFIIGNTPTEFLQLGRGPMARYQLDRILNRNRAALICVNDDVADHSGSTLPDALQHFFHQLLPDKTNRLPFELH